MGFQTNFKLGELTLPHNIFYAPLAGCSDFAFRQMSKQYNHSLVYCEMVKMDALIRNDAQTFHILDYEGQMHPIGGQICGSKLALAGPAAKIIEELGFDVVDLNCGCPVDKITKDGSGSGLLKTPQLIGDLVANMVAAVSIPVTIKIRAGWDEHSINAVEITKIAEEAGAKAICIHGRTREQGYKGAANWDYIRDCKAVAKKIQVIGNGDIFSAEAAEQIFQHTHCDAILVSRGTLGQPWIVNEIRSHLSKESFSSESFKPESPEELRAALLKHWLYTLSYHTPRRAVLEMRKIGCWYFKKASHTKAFREKMSRVNEIKEIQKLIEEFTFE